MRVWLTVFGPSPRRPLQPLGPSGCTGELQVLGCPWCLRFDKDRKLWRCSHQRAWLDLRSSGSESLLLSSKAWSDLTKLWILGYVLRLLSRQALTVAGATVGVTWALPLRVALDCRVTGCRTQQSTLPPVRPRARKSMPFFVPYREYLR